MDLTTFVHLMLLGIIGGVIAGIVIPTLLIVIFSPIVYVIYQIFDILINLSCMTIDVITNYRFDLFIRWNKFSEIK